MGYKIILLFAALVFAAAACNKAQTNQTPTLPSSKVTPTEITQQEISVTENGFSPKDVTIKKGSTITFINKGNKTVWPASDPHPTHTDYSGFDAKNGLQPGQKWTFTFDQAGEWGFHDHLSPFRRGTITVTE